MKLDNTVSEWKKVVPSLKPFYYKQLNFRNKSRSKDCRDSENRS